jgi:hypothetical protein
VPSMAVILRRKQDESGMIKTKRTTGIKTNFRTAQGGPEFKAQIEKRSRERVVERYGIQEVHSEREKLQQQIDAFHERLENLDRTIVQMLRDQGVTKGSRPYFSLENFLDSETLAIRREILQEFEIGRRIVQLQDEQEQLLDTVWLATSSVQIRNLWQDMMAILGESTTELQQQALSYTPATETETK